MSLKVYFLVVHLDYFLEHLAHIGEKHGKRFHQNIKITETRYQGRWNVTMMADYCWSLKRDGMNTDTGRNSKRKLVPHIYKLKSTKQLN